MSSKKNHQLTLVKTKSTLKHNQRLERCINEIYDIVNENLSAFDENDPNVIIYICELLENVTTLKLAGSDKQRIVLEILFRKCPHLNNDKDKEKLIKLINYLVESKLVKKIPVSTIIFKSVVGFVLKKLGV